jgi:hypothetical protein
MDLSYSGLIAYARTADARKKLRYGGVFAIFLLVSQIVFQLFGLLWLDNYTVGSLLAAAMLTGTHSHKGMVSAHDSGH